jgi:hypothetical protein
MGTNSVFETMCFIVVWNSRRWAKSKNAVTLSALDSTENYTNFAHKVPRLISYLGLGKCWTLSGKGFMKVLTDSVSELSGQRYTSIGYIVMLSVKNNTK